MMSWSVPVFRLFGIEVRAHWSWAFMGLLVGASLATGWFPSLAPGLAPMAYGSAALVCAIGLFLSIVAHEFCHALVGRLFSMRVERITMFLFGGVAHLEEEPATPLGEFCMAIAGPIASVILAFAFNFVYHANLDGPPLVPATFSYLASINIVVAAFNMLPGFPLDGGRVLRAALWHFKGDRIWATKISSGIGQFCGMGLIVIGLAALFAGFASSAIWAMLLGFLLMGFARNAYADVIIKTGLHGRMAVSFMDPTPPQVSPDETLEHLMREFKAHPETAILPVVDADKFVGCVDPQSAARIPREEWSSHHVRDILRPCEANHQILPEEDAAIALLRMVEANYRELLVVRGGRLLGLLTRSSLKAR